MKYASTGRQIVTNQPNVTILKQDNFNFNNGPSKVLRQHKDTIVEWCMERNVLNPIIRKICKSKNLKKVAEEKNLPQLYTLYRHMKDSIHKYMINEENHEGFEVTFYIKQLNITLFGNDTLYNIRKHYYLSKEEAIGLYRLFGMILESKAQVETPEQFQSELEKVKDTGAYLNYQLNFSTC